MGAIVFGTRLCGKVDEVRGVLHVATRFFHFCYVPLIPLDSWLVLAGTETPRARGPVIQTAYAGVRLPLNVRSVGFAWLRVLLVVLGGALLVYGGTLAAAAPSLVTGAFPVAGASLLGLAAASLRWSRASYPRALELARVGRVPLDHVKAACLT